jgi:hypothetical protein
MLHRVALVRPDVSEENVALVTTSVVPSSPILVTPMKEAPRFPPKRRFLKEPHGVTSQKIPFFIFI